MTSTDESTEPSTRLGREIKTVTEGTRATAQELQEFIQGMRGRSPQEVLGAVANSGLTQGLILSTVGHVVLFAIFTVIPYFVYGPPRPKAKATPPQAAASSPEPANAKTLNADKPAEATAATATATGDNQPNAKKALENLGETETKVADPKVNPLEKGLDDLLDGKK